MFGVFGKSRKQPSTTAEPADNEAGGDAMAQIKHSKQQIEKRLAYLTRKVEVETNNAIDHKNAGRKQQALACLKAKKMMEEEINGLMQRIVKVNAMEQTLSQLKFTESTLAAEQAAAAEIKRVLKRMGDLDDHRAETDEALEAAYDALGVVNEPVSVPGVTDWDDESLLEELEAIASSHSAQKAAQEAAKERELIDELSALDGIGAGTSGASFPSVPEEVRATRRRAQEEERELEELERLQTSMKVDKGGMAMLGAAPGAFAAPPPAPHMLLPSAA